MRNETHHSGHSRPTEEAVSDLLAGTVAIAGIASRRGVVIVRGVPRSDAPTDPEALIRRARTLGWTLRWEPTRDEVLVFVEGQRRHRLPWTPMILFLLTVLSVVFLRPFTLTGFQWTGFWEVFEAELPFAYALFPILLAHEFGHYFAARAHGYPASLPYFIPGFYPFGTFGALIIARYPFRNRRELFDIAVAGPIAGFLVCIPVLWYGLAHSEWVQLTGAEGLFLGDPLLMKGIAAVVMSPPPQPDMDILLHASAFGGWAGLFVTMLNLLPFGPLDGGKTAYALFGQRQRWVAIGAWGLLCLTLFYSYFWTLWLLLALVFRLPHPPTLNDQTSLGRLRLWIGFVVVWIFLLSFMPLPFRQVS